MTARPAARRLARRLTLAAAVLALAAPLGAQAPAALDAPAAPSAASAPVSPALAPAARSLAPSADALRAGVHTDTAAATAALDAAALQETESGLRRSTIFMLIGAAAVVIGAVTDEGALVVGGAVLGLTGLYFRLR